MTALGGFIMLHRKILNWEWYDSPSTKDVFIHLLLTASYTNTKWQGTEISRGSVITSTDSLSKALGLSTMQIRTALKHLKSTNEITINATSKFSIITITKYDEYQQITNAIASEQQADNEQTTSKQQHRNKVNKDNNVNKVNKVLAELPASDGIFYVYEDLYNTLANTYKQTDINESIKNLKAYLIEHPEKRRTVRKTRSYLEIWVKGDSKHNKCQKQSFNEYPATYDLEAYELASTEYMDKILGTENYGDILE